MKRISNKQVEAIRRYVEGKPLLTDLDLQVLGIRKRNSSIDARSGGQDRFPFVKLGRKVVRYRTEHVLKILGLPAEWATTIKEVLEEKRHHSPQDLAAYGIRSVQTTYNLRSAGRDEFQSIKFGRMRRRVRYPGRTLLKYIEDHTVWPEGWTAEA